MLAPERQSEPLPYGAALHANAHMQQVVRYKAVLIRLLREFLHDEGAIEVPMPILQRIREGAPVNQWSSIDPVTGELWFLRHCMEDHLRRLTPSFPKVFEIGKAIRAERRSASHATEFLVLELVFRDIAYSAGLDLIARMVRGPIAEAADREFKTGEVFRALKTRTWDDICMATLGTQSRDLNFRSRCVEWLKTTGVKGTEQYTSDWEVLEDVMKYGIEPACREPTLVTHFPRELQHVCDLDQNTDHAMRFSLVMNGIEFADGGRKFTGSAGYRRIYERNARYREEVLGLKDNSLPEEFFAELDKWPAPVFTSGVGIDRLTALVAGTEVADAIQFATG